VSKIAVTISDFCRVAVSFVRLARFASGVTTLGSVSVF
jgi:hypothetical protein